MPASKRSHVGKKTRFSSLIQPLRANTTEILPPIVNSSTCSAFPRNTTPMSSLIGCTSSSSRILAPSNKNLCVNTDGDMDNRKKARPESNNPCDDIVCDGFTYVAWFKSIPIDALMKAYNIQENRVHSANCDGYKDINTKCCSKCAIALNNRNRSRDNIMNSLTKMNNLTGNNNLLTILPSTARSFCYNCKGADVTSHQLNHYKKWQVDNLYKQDRFNVWRSLKCPIHFDSQENLNEENRCSDCAPLGNNVARRFNKLQPLSAVSSTCAVPNSIFFANVNPLDASKSTINRFVNTVSNSLDKAIKSVVKR